MATIHLPGAGLGSADGARRRRLAVVAGVVLVGAAIALPFALSGLDRDRPAGVSTGSTSVTPPTAGRPHHQRPATSDAALGSQAGLPALLPGQALQPGQTVRLGDVTDGTLRRTPGQGWQVMVRWAGRLQPLATRGPVTLGAGSWVARSGLLYTRVATATPGRYDVFAWQPQGGSAYAPPTLVASPLATVCFDASFTAYGGCR